VGFCDEACARRVRAQPLEPVHCQARHAQAMRQEAAHRVGMQRWFGDPIPGADLLEWRPGFAFGHRLLEHFHPGCAGRQCANYLFDRMIHAL
jgi:hypothetical protein